MVILRQSGKGIIVEHDEMSYVASPDVSLEFTQRSHKTEIALVRVDDIVHEDVFLFKSDAQGKEEEHITCFFLISIATFIF